VYALANGGRGLGRTSISFHSNRPRFRLGSICFTGSFFRFLARASGADFGAHDLAAPDNLSRFGPHKHDYSELGAALQYH